MDKLDKTISRIKNILNDLEIDHKNYHLYKVFKNEKNPDQNHYILMINQYSLNSIEVLTEYTKQEGDKTLKEKIKELIDKEKTQKMSW